VNITNIFAGFDGGYGSPIYGNCSFLRDDTTPSHGIIWINSATPGQCEMSLNVYDNSPDAFNIVSPSGLYQHPSGLDVWLCGPGTGTYGATSISNYYGATLTRTHFPSGVQCAGINGTYGNNLDWSVNGSFYFGGNPLAVLNGITYNSQYSQWFWAEGQGLSGQLLYFVSGAGNRTASLAFDTGTLTASIGSFSTNSIGFGATGITNTTATNLRLFGFTGTTVMFTNTITKRNVSLGTIGTGTSLILQPGEALYGTGCTEITNVAF
jgi:hypothetical protein